MAPVTIEYGTCKCQGRGTISIVYDDDPLGGVDPPVATCDQCTTPSESLLVQSGFQK